jgi:hypothetical protein
MLIDTARKLSNLYRLDNELKEPEPSFQNDDKNVPEQKVLSIDASTGQEEAEEAPFEDIKRHDVILESERAKKLEKRLDELAIESEILRRENKFLKEKTPELLREMQEKFHDQPGLIDAKKLQKISIEAGKNLVILIQRYNSILQEATERGQPVPFGTYIMDQT